MDVNTVAQALEMGTWQVIEIQSAELPEKYHYIQSPEAVQLKDPSSQPAQP
jgi:hypothetical protein